VTAAVKRRPPVFYQIDARPEDCIAQPEDGFASASNLISSPSHPISPEKFSFLKTQRHFFTFNSHFFPKVLISSQKFSFLPKSSHFFTFNSHFFPKVLISSKKFSLLAKSSHFLKCRSHFVTLAAHFSGRNRISCNAGAVSPFLASRRLCQPVFPSCRASFETGRRDSTSRESFTCNSRRSRSHRAQLFEIG